MTQQTGTDRVFEFLRDGRWRTTGEIERECDVTCHSRISDLRGRGHVIDKRRNRGFTGRAKFSYRLVATSEQLEEARGGGGPPLAEPVSAAAAGSASDDRSLQPHADLTANGESPGGQQLSPAVPPGPAAPDPHGIEDAGWRDLYTSGEQLDLGVAS